MPKYMPIYYQILNIYHIYIIIKHFLTPSDLNFINANKINGEKMSLLIMYNIFFKLFDGKLLCEYVTLFTSGMHSRNKMRVRVTAT
jgi:hypothetical protein